MTALRRLVVPTWRSTVSVGLVPPETRALAAGFATLPAQGTWQSCTVTVAVRWPLRRNA
jgi:hypothetical protein